MFVCTGGWCTLQCGVSITNNGCNCNCSSGPDFVNLENFASKYPLISISDNYTWHFVHKQPKCLHKFENILQLENVVPSTLTQNANHLLSLFVLRNSVWCISSSMISVRCLDRSTYRYWNDWIFLFRAFFKRKGALKPTTALKFARDIARYVLFHILAKERWLTC